MVDAYYMLPHAMRLLWGMGDKNITEALRDVYNFTLLHGIHLSDVTKEDFTAAIKTLMPLELLRVSHVPRRAVCGNRGFFRTTRPSGVPRGPATSTGSLASQRHPGKFPKVPGRRRGKRGFPAAPRRLTVSDQAANRL